MTETIIVALITVGLSLLWQQAVTDTRMEEQIKVINHQIADLEHNTNT